MFRRETLRIARKKHRCYMCRAEIGVGDTYMDTCGAQSGDFYHYKLCKRCDYVLDKFAIICDDELLPSIEEAVERVYEIECPNKECGRSDIWIELEPDKITLKCECKHCGAVKTINISLKGLKRFELIKKLKN